MAEVSKVAERGSGFAFIGAGLCFVGWLGAKISVWLNSGSVAEHGTGFQSPAQIRKDHDMWVGVASTVFTLMIVLLVIGVALLVVSKLARASEEQARSHAARAQADQRAVIESQRVAREEAARRDQARRAIVRQIAECASDSIDRFERMPRCLVEAATALDDAELDYRERALSPFWRNVEAATRVLGEFSEHADAIRLNATRYRELIAQYDGDTTIDAFPVTLHSVGALQASESVTRRMKLMIRAAERDRDFAHIGEMRRTNAILIAGFSTLGEAFDRMGSKISSSLDSLAASMDGVAQATNALARSSDANHRQMQVALSGHHRELILINQGHAAREERALGMLDDIRRDRKPFF